MTIQNIKSNYLWAIIPIVIALLFFYSKEIIYFYTKFVFSLQSQAMSENNQLICKDTDARLGQLGDFWGGLINPLLSLLSIILTMLSLIFIYLTLKTTRQELATQKSKAREDFFQKSFIKRLTIIEKLIRKDSADKLILLNKECLNKMHNNSISGHQALTASNSSPTHKELVIQTAKAIRTLINTDISFSIPLRDYLEILINELYPIQDLVFGLLLYYGHNNPEESFFDKKFISAAKRLQLFSNPMYLDKSLVTSQLSETEYVAMCEIHKNLINYYLTIDNGVIFGKSLEYAKQIASE